MQNFTASGGETVTALSPDGGESVEALSVTMKYATNTFDIYGCETVDGEESFEMRVIYDNITVYVDMGEDMRFKRKMSYEEFLASYGGEILSTNADYLTFDVYSEADLYEYKGEYYLDLKGNPDALTIEQLESLVEEDASLNAFSYRVYFDATGKILSERTTVRYVRIEESKLVEYTAVSDFVLSDVGSTRVTPPDDADEYIDADTPDEPDEPDEPDVGQVFSVTFKYVDANGLPISDSYGYTQNSTSVMYGGAVSAPYVNSLSAFDDYVVTGWKDAYGDTYDSFDLSYITESVTLYSVVRPKAVYDVSFCYSNGVVYYMLTVKEGDGVSTADVPTPVELGKYFKQWRFQPNGNSTTNCVRSNCSFTAVMGSTDGTVGKVTRGSVTVDGKRDAAYLTSGAYLPLNTKRQADAEITAAKDVEHGGDRAVPAMTADSYILWDGEYVYVLIEVSDKTLAGRSEAYAKNGIDAWLNDGVELRYYFEQGAVASRNHTRIGVDAMGIATYALGRDQGIGGGRSTHYDDIEYAVRNALTSSGGDLSRTGYVNNGTWTALEQANGKPEPARAPSYIVEFKIPAKTEGKADISHPAVQGLTGSAFESFLSTGLLPGRSPSSNNAADYAFTDGDALVSGDVIYLSLQVNDLAIGYAEMTGDTGTYFWDNPPASAIYAGFPEFNPQDPIHKTLLFATDGAGRITGMANTYGKFSAAGATQRDLNYYVRFTLGDSAASQSKILGMDVDAAGKTEFYRDKECTVWYFRD